MYHGTSLSGAKCYYLTIAVLSIRLLTEEYKYGEKEENVPQEYTQKKLFIVESTEGFIKY